MVLTLAKLRQSRASDLQKWTTAALDELYAGWSYGTLTIRAEMLVVAMNEPDPCALKMRAHSRAA